MRCNPIAQRVMLQEHLVKIQNDMLTQIEEWTSNEEKVKELKREHVDDMIDGWL